mgnify:CR=1 FL=1
MAKKRGKSKAKSSAKHSKKVKSSAAKKPDVSAQQKESPKPLKDALHDLEILAEEKKVEHKVEDVEKKEEEIEKKEAQIVQEERHLEKETAKVENLEKKIVKEVELKPLGRFNLKDLNKGIIGAFIGVVAHFGFIYGKAIANLISTPRATLLLVFSYLLLIILMYETGYREIKEKRLIGFLPKRATIIFATSLAVVIIIFFLFGMLDLTKAGLLGVYKQVAVTSVLASLGAGTADLLGKH